MATHHMFTLSAVTHSAEKHIKKSRLLVSHVEKLPKPLFKVYTQCVDLGLGWMVSANSDCEWESLSGRTHETQSVRWCRKVIVRLKTIKINKFKIRSIVEPAAARVGPRPYWLGTQGCCEGCWRGAAVVDYGGEVQVLAENDTFKHALFAHKHR